MNHVVLTGRATRDPEVKTLSGDLRVAKLGLAVPRSYKAQGGEREVDFINLVAWRKTAELFERYVSKGSRILVEGAMQMNKFTTKDGVERTVHEVVVDRVEFLDSKKSDAPGASRDTAEDDEMPF